MIRLADDQIVHWVAILSELASFRLDDKKIAARVLVDPKAVYAWRTNRAKPNGDATLRLLNLWHDTTGKAIASAPVISIADDWEP